MKKILLSLLAIVLTLSLAGIVIASDIDDAEYKTTITVSNNGTAATNVAAPFALSTAEMIAIGMLSADASDAAMISSGGADTAFMPASDNASPWITWVSSIGADSQVGQYLYSKGVTGSKIRYFPDDAGASANHSATLKLADNFTVEVNGFYNPVSGNIVVKDDAFYLISDDPGNIYAYIDSVNWTTPTSHTDPDTVWNDEANAYDDNTGSMADTGAITGWSGPLDLYYSDNIGINQLRYWGGGGITTIRFSLYYDDQWNIVFEGAEVPGSWQTIPFDFTVTDRIRIHTYYATAAARAIYEVDFGSVPYVAASGLTADEYTFKVQYQPNLLTNSSFETGNPPTGWTLSGANATFE